MRLEHSVSHERLERDAQRLVRATDETKRTTTTLQGLAARARDLAQQAARAASAIRNPLRR